MFRYINLSLKQFVLLCVAIILPVISFNVEQSKSGTPWIAEPFDLVKQGFESGLFIFTAGVRDTTVEYLSLLNIKKLNQELQLKNSQLEVHQTRFEEVLLENQRLRKLLDFKESSKMQLIAARVVGGDLFKDHKTLTINKGLENGLKAGMGVVTLQGVIGYVFRPDKWTSQVMLIEDRYSVVDAVVQRTRSHGIVEGKGQMGCSLKYVERAEDVQVGDVIVTGGLDNIFPKGFPVAVVRNVESKRSSVSVKVDLDPVVDPAKVEEVFVITNASDQDLNEQFFSGTPAPATTVDTTTESASR
ncbi:MAG: rod shape-determining protein MreC [Pseudobdellovibrionaceae bacterium]